MTQRLLFLLSLLFATVLAAAPALADKGMVVAADPRAAEAGREMLRAGGSAADAAMAMLLTLTVVEPQSSGIGGGGFLVYDDAKGGIATIDGRETAPAVAGPAASWVRTASRCRSCRRSRAASRSACRATSG